MATPDPFMDELRIMSYAPRPRACQEIYTVPRRNDFIEVFWCLDELPGLPNKWCPAEALHTSRDPDQDPKLSLAKGVLLYLPGETWNEQIDEVEFLDGQTLRCTANDLRAEPQADINVSKDNLNPTLKWRFREDTSSADEGNEWTPASDGASRKSGQSGSVLIRADIARDNARSHMELEMRTLRDGHASLTVDVEKLKRELVNLTHHLHALKKQEAPRHCARVQNAFYRDFVRSSLLECRRA